MTLSSNYETGNRWSTGDTTKMIDVSDGGTYTLSISETSWCVHSTSIVIAAPPLSVPFTDLFSAMSPNPVVYPNPTSGSFTISNLTEATVRLYSSTSGYIQSFESLSGDASIDIGHLSSGIYILRIVDKGRMWCEKIVLQK